ncbi:serine hydrolase domain-containing protein, partial [Steroidobacter sp.]|uniref:serine hydrolase domain-containing protein n=1 Tax=Steroidobacter sp. TaxID=1978227 RepID=UPI001A4D846C
MSFALEPRRRAGALLAKVANSQAGEHSLGHWLLLGLTLIGISSAASADAIDDYMQAQLARYNTPGLALGIVKNGEIVRTQGYGFANLEHSAPMRADSVFQSASTGKMFTAVAAMLLVEDGKLRLDESIRTYLPDAPAAWQPITLRLMLNHISGLDRNLDAAEPRTDYTTEQLLQLYYQTQLKYAPAERFLYSNIGYELVGLVVEKVSGERSYVDLLKKRVFDPLGMTSARAIDLRAVIAHRAAGYQPGPGGELLNQEFESESLSAQGSSGLYLSAQDYARWEVGVRNRKILSEASWQEIFRPATLASGRSYPYGFGW